MKGLRFAFMRAVPGGATTPAAYYQPYLACEVKKDGKVHLTLSDAENYGLRETLERLTASSGGELTLPYRGSLTYDMLKAVYAERVGAVRASVNLQDQPVLRVEEIDLGWAVLKLGGAEYEHFEGLAARLRDNGCEVRRGFGRNDEEAVFFRLPSFATTSELDMLFQLRSVITGRDA